MFRLSEKKKSEKQNHTPSQKYKTSTAFVLGHCSWEKKKSQQAILHIFLLRKFF